MAGICGNYHESSDCFEYPNQATQKNMFQNFPTHKNRELENFKSFDHHCHLKYGGPPWGLPAVHPSQCKQAISVIWHNY